MIESCPLADYQGVSRVILSPNPSSSTGLESLFNQCLELVNQCLSERRKPTGSLHLDNKRRRSSCRLSVVNWLHGFLMIKAHKVVFSSYLIRGHVLAILSYRGFLATHKSLKHFDTKQLCTKSSVYWYKPQSFHFLSYLLQFNCPRISKILWHTCRTFIARDHK